VVVAAKAATRVVSVGWKEWIGRGRLRRAGKCIRST
jgi:hypothetical protein